MPEPARPDCRRFFSWKMFMSPAPPKNEKRRHLRRARVGRAVLIHGPTGRTFACELLDFSEAGARLRLVSVDLPDRHLTLVDGERGLVHETRIVWREALLVGIEFTATAKVP